MKSDPESPIKSKRNSSLSRLPSNNNLQNSRLSQEIGSIKDAEIAKGEPPRRTSIRKIDQLTKNMSLSIRDKVGDIMKSKIVEIIIVMLIVIYCFLVLANVVLDDCDNKDEDGVLETIKTLKFVELGIVILFVLEILLKIYGFGLHEYFQDCWYIFDAIIILVTLGLVIVDLNLADDSTLAGLSRIRGLFRLVRIFLLIRKATSISRTPKPKIKVGGFDVKSPAEKIMDLLQAIKASTKDKELIKELAWAIEIIQSNKLYDPIIEEGVGNNEGQPKSEVNLWITSYGTKTNNVANNTQPKNRRLSKFGLSQLPRRTSTILSTNKGRSLNRMATIKIASDATKLLDERVEEIEFNIFDFKAACGGDELSVMANHFFEQNNFFDLLNIDPDTFSKFIYKIQGGYLPNTYHNSTHAADVVQTVHYLITKGNFVERAELSPLENAAIYLSAAVHDYEHPGTNNVYQISIGSEYAIRYNDKSVLENHHIAATFQLMKDDNYNIMKNFTREGQKSFRERTIAMVLGTDMQHHFPDIAQLKGKLNSEFDIKKEKNFIMNLVLHSADISNPAKPWDICKEWTTKVMGEFFEQGDRERERGLPITNLCDRYTVNVGKSQIGFIDFVVAPLLNLMKEVLPGINISHMEANKEKWKSTIEHYDKELAALNEKKKAAEQEIVEATR